MPRALGAPRCRNPIPDDYSAAAAAAAGKIFHMKTQPVRFLHSLGAFLVPGRPRSRKHPGVSPLDELDEHLLKDIGLARGAGGLDRRNRMDF
jgi:hypothetical protein